MEIGVILVVLIGAFIAFKVLKGVVKIAVIVALISAAIWFLSGGMA